MTTSQERRRGPPEGAHARSGCSPPKVRPPPPACAPAGRAAKPLSSGEPRGLLTRGPETRRARPGRAGMAPSTPTLNTGGPLLGASPLVFLPAARRPDCPLAQGCADTSPSAQGPQVHVDILTHSAAHPRGGCSPRASLTQVTVTHLAVREETVQLRWSGSASRGPRRIWQQVQAPDHPLGTVSWAGLAVGLQGPPPGLGTR